MLKMGIHVFRGVNLNVLEIALNYLDPAVSLARTDYLTYTICAFLIISYLLISMFIILFLSQWNFKRNDRHSLAYFYLQKIVGVIIVMLKHIFGLPILFLLVETIKCEYHLGDGTVKSPSFECFGTVHIVLLGLSILAIILVSCFMLISLTLFSDEKLESTLPWAFCSRRLDIYRYLRKIYICFILCYCSSSEELFTISYLGLILISCGCLYELYHQIYMNYISLYYSLITSECLILCISLLSSLNIFSDKDWTNPIGFGLIFIILFFMSYFFSILKRKKLMLNKSIEDIRNISDLEIYSRILIFLSNSHSLESKLDIHGIIAFHTSRCNREGCYCRKIAALEEKELEELDDEENYLKKMSWDQNEGVTPIKQVEAFNSELEVSIGINTTKEVKPQKLALYKFLIDMINEWNESQDEKARLQLLLAYLKLYCYEHYLPALYQLMCASESSPTFYDEFLIFRCLRQIEEQIILRDTNLKSSNEIDNLINFQQILAEMQENMQESLKLFIGFWKELLDESPNFQYIGNMSHEISQLEANIRIEYSQLIEINPINLYCRMLYALFNKKIIQDEYEANDVYEDINSTHNNIQIRHSYVNEGKFGSNSKTSLFIISGEKNNLGEVLCINNEVCEMFGYERKDIQGNNISHLMTPALASVHTQLVLNYFNSGAVSAVTDRLIFPLHKLGYIIPCTILHRTSPDLSQGLQLIGFVYKVNDFSEYTSLVEKGFSPDEIVIFLTDEKFGLHAFNIKAAKLLGVDPALSNIKKFLIEEEKISLKKLISDLNSNIFLDEARSPGIAQTTLDMKKINHIIESEIECLKNEKKQDLLPTSFPIDEEVKEITIFEGKIRGPLSYMDLQYGKYTKHQSSLISSKLVMAFLEIVEEKTHSRENDIEEESLNMKKKQEKQDLFLDDLCSQSQSSHSSTSASYTERKNIRTFKERIKTQENPFFVRCFIKLGIIIFLIIFGSSIIDFVLIRLHLRLLDTSYKNADLIYKRYNSLVAIPNSFRTLYQIYLGNESCSSEIYTNRSNRYLSYIDSSLEDLREYSNQIDSMDHSFSDAHRNILDNPVVQFVKKPDTYSVSNEVSYTYQKMLLAITKYVAMGTEIKTYNSSWLCSGAASASSQANYTIDRLMSFMITNGKGSLRYYVAKSQNYFYEEMQSSIKSSDLVILVSLIITPIIITFLMILFIPFILKVQSNLLRIYLHLCQFSPEDLNKWLEECNNSAFIITASISQIKKMYAAEIFEIKIVENINNNLPVVKHEEETTMQSMMNNTTTKAVNSEEKFNDEKEDSEETFMENIETVSERKQKMFSSMTQQKTRVYLLFLLCFAFYIGIFRTFDGVAFYYVTNETELRQYIYHLLSDRSISQISSQLFVREQYIEQSLQSDRDHVNLTEYFIDLAFDAEMGFSRIRPQLSGHLTGLKDYLNQADTSDNCNKLYESDKDITKCENVYDGLLSQGFNSVNMHAAIFAKKVDGLFRKNGYVSPDIASSSQQIKMNDVRTKYEDRITNQCFVIYGSLLQNWIEEQILIQNLKFSGFIILLFSIFILLWRQMVINMQMDIKKALGILNILPTSHLSAHPEFIQEMGKSSLINQGNYITLFY